MAAKMELLQPHLKEFADSVRIKTFKKGQNEGMDKIKMQSNFTKEVGWICIYFMGNHMQFFQQDNYSFKIGCITLMEFSFNKTFLMGTLKLLNCVIM